MSESEYKLVQFEMSVPDAITERFAKWMQAISTDQAMIVGKPIACSLSMPNGEAYKDSTFHAQTYRAIAAHKAGANWAKKYPALAHYRVRYIHKRTALTLTRKTSAPLPPVVKS